jgi:hypothetical protein
VGAGCDVLIFHNVAVRICYHPLRKPAAGIGGHGLDKIRRNQ